MLLSQIERNHSDLSSLKAMGTVAGVGSRRGGADGTKGCHRAGESVMSRSEPDLSDPIEFILGMYEPQAATGAGALAYPVEQCSVMVDGIADVTLYDTVHYLRAEDSSGGDCSVLHLGRKELRDT